MTFVTNEFGGSVSMDFSNLVFENLQGQGNALQAVIIRATVPCISSSYTERSNCVNNATSNFTLTTDSLSPNTTYYAVVNGAMGSTHNAEATFDVSISGEGVQGYSDLRIWTPTTTICRGNTLSVSAYTQYCSNPSNFEWYLNDELIATTQDSLFVYDEYEDHDVLKAIVSCENPCGDSIVSNSITIKVLDLFVDAGKDTTIHKGEAVQLQGSSDAASVAWTPTEYMSNPSILKPMVSPLETTIYYLTGSNTYCSITDQTTVFVLDDLTIPNMFTPNGDGINDNWDILGIEDFPDCHIQIFTRWGQLVFQTNGYPKEKRWEGTSQSGKELAEGTYYYVIDLRDPDRKSLLKGSVSIVR